MPITRRSALAVLTLGVAGCAGSPVIVGQPATAPVVPPPAEPTRSPEAAAAHQTMASLRALLATLSTSPVWEAQPWAVAAMAQCDAHLARLALPDPLATESDQETFDVEVAVAPSPSDAVIAANRLSDSVAHTVDALATAASAAPDDNLRLLYASASTAVLGLHGQGVAPVEGDGVPRRLQHTTVEASLPILLGHAWALVYGLGVGLGRLKAGDPLYELGTARLDQVRELRNQLRDELGEATPAQPAAFALPTAMDTPDSIREAWGLMEVDVLNSYARLVAADSDSRWHVAMREQVQPVQALGTALSWWPGWLA